MDENRLNQGARTRLCLIAPAGLGETELKDALAAGDVAALLLTNPATASALGKLAQGHGVAAILVQSDASPKASVPEYLDGMHVEGGAEALKQARGQFGRDRIVGAGGVATRHDAMTLGESLPDYVFFGRIDDGDVEAMIHPDAERLAGWWASLFEIPAMLRGGSDLASVETAARSGVEFVALRDAIWNHLDGAAAAVAQANAVLSKALP